MYSMNSRKLLTSNRIWSIQVCVCIHCGFLFVFERKLDSKFLLSFPVCHLPTLIHMSLCLVYSYDLLNEVFYYEKQFCYEQQFDYK